MYYVLPSIIISSQTMHCKEPDVQSIIMYSWLYGIMKNHEQRIIMYPCICEIAQFMNCAMLVHGKKISCTVIYFSLKHNNDVNIEPWWYHITLFSMKYLFSCPEIIKFKVYEKLVPQITFFSPFASGIPLARGHAKEI